MNKSCEESKLVALRAKFIELRSKISLKPDRNQELEQLSKEILQQRFIVDKYWKLI